MAEVWKEDSLDDREVLSQLHTIRQQQLDPLYLTSKQPLKDQIKELCLEVDRILLRNRYFG